LWALYAATASFTRLLLCVHFHQLERWRPDCNFFRQEEGCDTTRKLVEHRCRRAEDLVSLDSSGGGVPLPLRKNPQIIKSVYDGVGRDTRSTGPVAVLGAAHR